MAADVIQSVGTQVYVSAAEPATYNSAGFGALSWTEVGEVESLGEYGGSAQISQFIPLATGTVKKRKGSLDYGTASMVIGKTTDSGLAAMKSGFDGANKDVIHSFKIVESDGSIGYFTAVIASYVYSLGDANTITRINCNVDLTNKVVEA